MAIDQDAGQLQRNLQQKVAAADKACPREQLSTAMQAGARRYPERSFEESEPTKPGIEAQLKLAPMYEPPNYRGSGKLTGKKAIITWGDSGIGRAVAILFAREGADVAIMHQADEADDAEATIKANQAERRRGLSIAGDVRNRAFCFDSAKRASSEFGGLDILVNNAAFQLHVSRFQHKVCMSSP